MKTQRIRPPKHDPHSDYHRIWRIVDGAVRDAFKHHPDYLTTAGHRSAQLSIIKRVAGALAGHVFREDREGSGGNGSGNAHVSGRNDDDQAQRT